MSVAVNMSGSISYLIRVINLAVAKRVAGKTHADLSPGSNPTAHSQPSIISSHQTNSNGADIAGLSPDITLSSAPDVTASYLHMQMTRPLPRGPVVPRLWRAWLCAFARVCVSDWRPAKYKKIRCNHRRRRRNGARKFINSGWNLTTSQ
jgi:hypothetical protein